MWRTTPAWQRRRHPLIEGRQHALRPDRRFGPGPRVAGLSRSCSPEGHCRGGVFRRYGRHASTFLHPFAPRALPRFNATMSALTPMRHSSPHRSPCFTCTAFRPFRPQPPCVPNTRRFRRGRRRFSTLPLSATGLPRPHLAERDKASPLASRLAETPGRIGFVILRTGRSPPAALHPASRRRSCSRLQAGKRFAWRGLSPL